MTQETRINAVATQIGTDIGNLIASQGLLSGLTTTDKSNLVAAINEVAANAAVGALIAANNLSDVPDSAAARTNLSVMSTTEVTNAIAAVTLGSLGGLDQAAVDARVNLVVDTAPAALDTLNEIAAAIGDDANFAGTVTGALTDRVSYAAAQTKTVGEKLQACQNLGIGDPEADYLAIYTTARDA